MNAIIRWITTHPVAANLAMLFVVVFGLASAASITQKVFPDFTLDVVVVSVVYPGASPAEIEQSIVRPIEEQLSAIDGIDEMTSSAVEGMGTVRLSLLLGEDVATTLDEVKGEIDRVTTFPEDAEAPTVVQASQPERVLELTLHGPADPAVLKAEAERLEDALVRLDGVSFVELGNVLADEVSIEVDRDALAAHGLSVGALAERIGASSLELPAGSLETDTLSIPLRTLGRNYTRADFAGIVIATDERGGKLRLGDVARVVDGFEDVDFAATFDGEPTVSVNVYRVGSEQVLDLVETTKAYLTDTFEPSLPEGLDVTIWQNDAQELQNRLDLLGRNAIIGLTLVMLCLTLFLDFRLAAWAAAGIGIAFVATFIVMGAFGMTINMISLFGFILAIGIVVDNAIVIGENVYKNAEDGPPARGGGRRRHPAHGRAGDLLGADDGRRVQPAPAAAGAARQVPRRHPEDRHHRAAAVAVAVALHPAEEPRLGRLRVDEAAERRPSRARPRARTLRRGAPALHARPATPPPDVLDEPLAAAARGRPGDDDPDDRPRRARLRQVQLSSRRSRVASSRPTSRWPTAPRSRAPRTWPSG